LREEARAQEAAARAVERHAVAQARLAETLVDATQAEVARIAITNLGDAMRSGEISVEKYERLVAKLQLAFGLATEESIQMATGMDMLMGMMDGGEMRATDFIAALRGLTEATGADSLMAPAPSGNGAARGDTNNNSEFNMTVHTAATTAAVQQDFAAMQALAGR